MYRQVDSSAGCDAAPECQRRLGWRRKLEVSPAEKGSILALQRDLQSRLHAVEARGASTGRRGERGSRGKAVPAGDAAVAEEKTAGIDAEEPSDSQGEADSDLDDSAKKAREAEADPSSSNKSWQELTERQKHQALVKVVKRFSQKAHKKTKIQKVRAASSLLP